MSETSEIYRRLIEDHRARARNALTPSLGRSLLRLAQAYERLVAEGEIEEQRAAFDSRPFLVSRYVLGDLAARLETTSEGQERIGMILDAAIALHAADYGNIQVLHPQSDTLKIVAQRNFEAEFLATFTMVDATDGSACGRALQSAAPVIVEDVLAERSLEPYRAVFGRAGVRAVQSTPILGPAGAVIGVLSTHFGRVHRPSALDMAAAEICASYAADVLGELLDQPPGFSGPTGRVAT